ncbi:ABC transporter permease [Larkinella insperata]|uniref:ABC transporter permease n=1 Tax=Larkinella insperata TaxID=332158 RepID=A0ABW3QF12_9BACT|nr:ABC transporter permease [Larkinella insperata]
MKPPRLADRLLELFCAPDRLEEVLGDLHEEFAWQVRRVGERRARMQYWQEVLGFFKPFVWRSKSPFSSIPTQIMLTNYFKISLRTLWRNRLSSALSTVGLAVGLASGLLIFLLVSWLFSFDRYHAKADRIYWIVTDVKHDNVVPSDATPRPLGDVLRRDYPFVESAVRMELASGKIIGVPDGKGGLAKKFEESRNVGFVEPQFFDVFDVEWAKGNRKAALRAPNTVVLSERYAQKYFDGAEPIGRTLRLDNQASLTVTGVIKNPPSNTKLGLEMLISYSTLPTLTGNPELMQQWSGPSTLCFVALREGTPVERLVQTFPTVRRKYMAAQEAKLLNFHALPLSDLNHNPQYGGRAPRPILYALIMVGVFLVVAACINFINVATARAIRRSKEVGVRKAVGSTRRQLIGQFLTEATLVTLVAVVVALVLTQLNLPLLNSALAVLHADLSILDIFRPDSLLWFGGLILGVILMAGFYPSVVLSRFNPVAALRGRLTTQQVGGLSVRRGLVIVQFFITQLFVIGAIVMTRQVRHLQQADLGFNKESVLTVPVPTKNPLKQQTLREQLAQIPGVEQVALGGDPPASHRRPPVPFTYDRHAEPEKFPVSVKVGDKAYGPLFRLKLVAGRNFSTNDSTNAEALVNQAMIRQLGLRTPAEILGKRLTVFGLEKTIVGVINDFSLGEMHGSIPPTALLNLHTENTMAALKVAPANLPATVAAVEKTWNELFPENVYRASFVDELVNQFYLTERILLVLIQVFSLVAILIGCLGIYGLVVFIAESKTKEIGVRKVLGATRSQLLWLFGREFGRLVLFGFLVAAPLGRWLMGNWLRSYEYRIELDWWIFALAMLLTSLITLVTVSYESIKASLVNPVKSLRSE